MNWDGTADYRIGTVDQWTFTKATIAGGKAVMYRKYIKVFSVVGKYTSVTGTGGV